MALALTADFRTFERYGLVMQPDDKDAALLPRRIDGNFALLHRPIDDAGAHIWMSYSPDLRNWGGHGWCCKARRGGWWDANKIGLSPPLIETPTRLADALPRRPPHGARARSTASALALLDLEHPERCLLRGESWVFGPEAPYELQGDVANVVFPCGTTLGADGDTLHVYYGAADTSIGVATASLTHLLSWLDANGAPDQESDASAAP